VDAWRAVRGDLPLRVKFIIEGEEEIGSPHLGSFADEHPELIAADACIWEFGSTDIEGRPLVHLGLKGICYVELRARGASGDQHSSVATSVPNPAWRLVWALAGLKGEDERVLIPGFYDKVKARRPTSWRCWSGCRTRRRSVWRSTGSSGFCWGRAGSS
jgi:acetylornithine deacetylase/succinyl-diaminopimelate desuccinylase-like protein